MYIICVWQSKETKKYWIGDGWNEKKLKNKHKKPFSPHHPQNHLRRNAHFSEGTKACTHILQTGAQQKDFVIDNQETVVVAVGQLDKLYFWILGVVFLQVGEELFVVTGVDGR